MKKIETLKKNYEFKNVLSKGKFYRGNFITIYILKNNKNVNIIGTAISKKLCKANKRNRLKRLVRESYRLQKNNLEQGYNIVFIWNKQIDVNNHKCMEIQNDMNNLFKKSGILK